MAAQTKILLIGAGELGTAFLHPLSSIPNTHITLGVRSPEKYLHLASPCITPKGLDITSPSAELSATFSRYDILISATGFGQDPSSVHKLAQEALDAGKLKKERGEGRLWFFPWQWGVDYDITGDGEGLMPLFGAQRDVRNLLRAEAEKSNLDWTIVSTGIFMSFLFEPFWGVVDRDHIKDGRVTVRCLGSWEHGVTVTDVSDIGRVLGRVVGGDVDARNRVVYVAGDTVRYEQLAEIVGRVLGSKVKVEREEWSIPLLEQELSKDPDDGIKKYRLVFARPGVFWEKEKTVNHQLGMEMLDVETYAQKLFK